MWEIVFKCKSELFKVHDFLTNMPKLSDTASAFRQMEENCVLM